MNSHPIYCLYFLILCFTFSLSGAGCQSSNKTKEDKINQATNITKSDTIDKADRFEFVQIKKADPNKASLAPEKAIVRYQIIFNPKVNGSVTIVLSDSSQYVASSLNGSQISTVRLLLQAKGVSFNPSNELIINEKLK